MLTGRQRQILVAIVAAVICCLNPQAFAQDAENKKPDPLQLMEYISWWSHDDAGYHPAVTFYFENVSGDDLSGSNIRFQARFMDLRNNYLSVERQDKLISDLRAGREVPETMICPEAYELPISIYAWPRIECKVLYKIGDEREPHQLFVAMVDKVTMTTEEAEQKLVVNTTPIARSNKARHNHKRPDPPPQPLSAGTALPLGATAPPSHDPIEKKAAKAAAGLGDDFFEFEQSFGRPVSFDSSSGKYTWVRYSRDKETDVYAGARQPTSKADIIVVEVSSHKVVPEPQLIQIGREFAGKLKSQALNGPTRTVKYYPTGRVQLSTLSSSTYHFHIYSTTDASETNHYTLILSRLPGDFEPVVALEARKSKLMHFLEPLFGESD